MSQGKTLNSEQIRTIARLTFAGFTKSAIGIRERISRITVAHIQRRLFKANVVSENILKSKSNQELLYICYGSTSSNSMNDDAKKVACISRSEHQPDFEEIALDRIITRENKQFYYFRYIDECSFSSVTPITRSSFYRLLKDAEDKLKIQSKDPVMIIDKPYGVSCEIDFAGTKLELTLTGGIKETFSVFVATWSASCYTFGCFVQRQSTEATCNALANAFQRWGCLPHEIIPDNAKAWVEDCSVHGESVTNRSFNDYLSQFGVFISPASPRSPTHKSRVEFAVRLLTERVISKYDTKQELNLQEHNICLQKMIDKYINQAPFHKDPNTTREFLFEHCEKSHARAMINVIPSYAVVSYAKVRRNYHIEHNGKLYSVPYKYINHTVTVKEYENSLSIYCDSKLIATHAKLKDSDAKNSTQHDHMPENHQKVIEKRKYRTIDDVLSEAQRLSHELYTYCKYKSEHTRSAPLKSCLSVLNMYIHSSNKAILSEVLNEVMKMPDDYRNYD